MKKKPTVQICSVDEETCTVDFKGMRVYGMPINNQTKNQMNKVTKESIEAKIKDKYFKRLSEKLTHCTIVLENGFEITGESACVDPRNYDQAIGEKCAYEQAFDKIWMLEGYLLQERIFLEKDLDDQIKKFGEHSDLSGERLRSLSKAEFKAEYPKTPEQCFFDSEALSKLQEKWEEQAKKEKTGGWPEKKTEQVENPARDYCLDMEASIFKSLFIDNKIKGQERFEKMKLLFDRMFPDAPSFAFGVANGNVVPEKKGCDVASPDYLKIDIYQNISRFYADLRSEKDRLALFIRMFPNAPEGSFNNLEAGSSSCNCGKTKPVKLMIEDFFPEDESLDRDYMISPVTNKSEVLNKLQKGFVSKKQLFQFMFPNATQVVFDKLESNRP